MRCNYVPCMYKKEIRNAAVIAAKQDIEDAASRAQYIWMVAMLKAGLSPRTVKRVINELDEVQEQYVQYKKDGIADYALVSSLEKCGVKVAMPKNEI